MKAKKKEKNQQIYIPFPKPTPIISNKSRTPMPLFIYIYFHSYQLPVTLFTLSSKNKAWKRSLIWKLVNKHRLMMNAFCWSICMFWIVQIMTDFTMFTWPATNIYYLSLTDFCSWRDCIDPWRLYYNLMNFQKFQAMMLEVGDSYNDILSLSLSPQKRIYLNRLIYFVPVLTLRFIS